MRASRLALAFGLLCAPACGNGGASGVDAAVDVQVSTDAGPPAQAPPVDGASAPRAPFAGEGLLETGALAVFRPRARTAARLYLAAPADGGAPAPATAPQGQGPGEWIEISAPILPYYMQQFMIEGTAYPATQAAREDAAHRLALLYDQLLAFCADKDARIKLRGPSDPPLTKQEILENYEAVAACAYQHYTSKPYWIPQLVSDVDICGRELGPDWKLVSEQDLARVTLPEYLLMQQELDGAGGGFFASFYFQLRLFIRAADGTIQEGRLDPREPMRVVPLRFQQGWDSRHHYEGGLALRCLRRTEVVE
jgi:hypothetical protein